MKIHSCVFLKDILDGREHERYQSALDIFIKDFPMYTYTLSVRDEMMGNPILIHLSFPIADDEDVLLSRPTNRTEFFEREERFLDRLSLAEIKLSDLDYDGHNHAHLKGLLV